MTEAQLRASVLKITKMTDAPKEEQDMVLGQIETIAHERLALALPDLLSEAQLKTLNKMDKDGKDDDTIAEWIEKQLPDYKGMMEDIIQDVAEEIADF